jgi:PAS domain S-box-containing protein
MRLRYHLVALVVGVVLPLMAFSLVMVFLANRQARTATEVGLQETARALSVAVDQEVRAVIAVLRILANSDDMQADDLKGFEREVRAALTSQTDWENIVLFSPTGQGVLNTHLPPGGPLPRSTRPELIDRVVRTRAPAVSGLFRAPVRGTPLVEIAAPVLRAGAVKYVLSAYLSSGALTTILAQQRMPAEGVVSLLDQNRLIIARTRMPEQFVGQQATPELATKMSQGADGAIHALTKNGQLTYSAFGRSPLTGWTVVLGISASDIDAPLRRSLWWLLGIGTLCLGLGIAIAALVARKIAQPILSLVSAAKKLDLGEPAGGASSSVTEVRDLTEALASAGRERRHAKARTAALASVGRELAGTLDPERTAQLITSTILTLFGAGLATLFRLEQPSNNLVCTAAAVERGQAAAWVGNTIPPGGGVSGLAIEAGRPIWTQDILHDPRVVVPQWMAERVHEDGYSSVIAVPLVAQDRTFGVLALGVPAGHAFSDEEVALLSAFADQAALALENSRAHAESERRRHEAEELARVARGLTETLDAGEVARRIVETILPLFRAEDSILRLLEPDGSLRGLAAGGSMRDSLALGHMLPPGIGLMGRVVAEGRPLWSANLSTEAGIERTEDYSRRMAATPARAALAVPLRTKGRMIGVLGIGDQAGRAFREPEVTLLQAFADQAALALENARLYADSVQQKEHLANQAALLTTTLENIGHGLAVFDRDLRLVAWNSRFLDLLELPPEFGRVGLLAAEIFRHNAARGDYGPGSVEERVARELAWVRQFKPHHFEWRRHDGTVVDVRGNPLPGGGMVSTFTDVTALKVVDQTLLKLSSAVEQTADMVVITSRAGVIEYVNPAFEAVTGYTREQVIDNTPRLLKSGQHDRAFYQELWDTVLSGRVYRGVIVNRKQSGAVYFEDKTITPLTEATGTITHFVSTGRDITEQMLAERAMQAIVEGTAGAVGEELYRSLVRHLAQALGVRYAIVGELTGPAKDRVLTLAVWSGSDFAHNFDYPLADSPCAGLTGGEQCVYPSGVRAAFPRHELLERMRAEGYLGMPLQASTGDVLGVLVVMDDEPLESVARARSLLKIFASRAGAELEREQAAAALHEQERQLRQAQKMDAIGQLVGGIAHDFNNLLTVIGGYSELLLLQMSPGDRAYRDIGLIAKTAERAGQLTRQLLAFSRRQVLDLLVLDLNAVVVGMEPLLSRLIGEHITLTTRTDSSLWRAKGDVGQLGQVIMNLAVNARDAMPEGGQLAIETGNVTLDDVYARSHAGAVPGPYVMLAVSDTGVGMDAKTLSHAFEPFFTTKEAGKGTGLGLAMVYGIVKQSGGYVSVDSELGHGATFRIYLPRVEETAAAGGTTAEPDARPPGSETVLLVEDEEGVRDLVHEILKTLGYTVLEARHPEEAVQIAAQHHGPIHLLLTDVVMPGMSGPILVGRLQPGRPGLKVLYMSGHLNNSIVRHGVLAAGTALVQKPFTLDALARKVREVLDSAPP